ncbi:HAD family hydrolase [Sandarakinorhabdus sp.]|uniref:HAD family hydrolase n=1 Tax=Sandarakinorhabdus sp. TaxID=1916663 RepID=UPI003340107B
MNQTRAPGRIIRSILFDLDGTLVDSARITCAIIDAMLAARGATHTADPQLVRAMDGIGGEAMIAAVMGRHCRDPAEDIAEFRALHIVAATPDDLAFPGAAHTLAALHSGGLRLAICSNKPQALCEKILGDLDLARHFGAIVGARPQLARKPAADPAVLAMAAIGADPATSLVVGDTLIDAATALAAGVGMVLAGWGYGVAAALHEMPGLPVLQSLNDLLVLAGPAGKIPSAWMLQPALTASDPTSSR